MAPPAPPTWGAVLRAPPPVGCHSGGVARRAGLRGAGVGTLVRLAEPHKKGGDRRGTDGAAVHYRPSPSPPTATRTGSPPLVPLCAVRPPLQCHPPRRPPYQSAAAMASSRSTAEAPTEEMASPRAGRTTPAPSGTPASATAKSGSYAAGSPRVGRAPGSTGAFKVKGSTTATLRAGGAATSAPATPAGATSQVARPWRRPGARQPAGRARPTPRPRAGSPRRRGVKQLYCRFPPAVPSRRRGRHRPPVCRVRRRGRLGRTR